MMKTNFLHLKTIISFKFQHNVYKSMPYFFLWKAVRGSVQVLTGWHTQYSIRLSSKSIASSSTCCCLIGWRRSTSAAKTQNLNMLQVSNRWGTNHLKCRTTKWNSMRLCPSDVSAAEKKIKRDKTQNKTLY